MSIYHDLFSQLTSEDLILTANHRLAEYLWIQRCNYSNSKPINIPILPFTNWLKECYSLLSLATQQPRGILETSQELFLWQEIIQNSSYGQFILYPAQTASLVAKAWEICKQWKINSNEEIFTHTQDSLAFQTWANSFAQLCQEKTVIDLNSLPEFLIPHLLSNNFKRPKRIFLLGFDEINPQYQYLLLQLKQQGSQIIHYKKALPTANYFQFKALDEEEEIRSMAEWAHNLFINGVKKIGCVIPNLTEIHQEISTIFTDVFFPQTKLNPNKVDNKFFNVSVGNKLAQYPLIATAIKILKLNKLEELANISLLIRSPFIGEAITELNQRAKLDVELRNQTENYIYLQQVMLTAKQKQVVYLYQRLNDFLTLCKNSDDHRSHQEWVQYFDKVLTSLGWPGEASLNEHEQVIITNWNKLLATFVNLSDSNKSISREKAIEQIVYLSNFFEVNKSSSNAPIQILGVLEASGIEFDYLWVAQINEKQWPGLPNPNPFIPFALQREHKTPHSTNQREFEYCRDITLRLLETAQHIIFSYAEQKDDQPINPSIFIQKYPLMNKQDLNLPEHRSIADQIFRSNSNQCEYIIDDYGPAIAAEEKNTGGAAIFKYQAACPFKAFTRLRLHATPLEYPSIGLNSKERGILLHQILESIWNEIKTQVRLVQYTEEKLLALTTKTVTVALLDITRKKPLTMQPYFVTLEKKRLIKLVLSWLEIEAKRPSFSIQTIEQTQISRFAEIEFKQRIDRIDRLADGSILIIDYKTGLVTTNAWLGSRPEDPQLPLYCLTNPGEVAGIAYAQIRSDKKQFKGIAGREVDIPGIDVLSQQTKTSNDLSWHELLDQWKQVLNNIGETFKHGYAVIDPKDGIKTCLNCELKLVCRINHNEDITHYD